MFIYLYIYHPVVFASQETSIALLVVVISLDQFSILKDVRHPVQQNLTVFRSQNLHRMSSSHLPIRPTLHNLAQPLSIPFPWGMPTTRPIPRVPLKLDFSVILRGP